MALQVENAEVELGVPVSLFGQGIEECGSLGKLLGTDRRQGIVQWRRNRVVEAEGERETYRDHSDQVEHFGTPKYQSQGSLYRVRNVPVDRSQARPTATDQKFSSR
jgi:hypothetical protein